MKKLNLLLLLFIFNLFTYSQTDCFYAKSYEQLSGENIKKINLPISLCYNDDYFTIYSARNNYTYWYKTERIYKSITETGYLIVDFFNDGDENVSYEYVQIMINYGKDKNRIMINYTKNDMCWVFYSKPDGTNPHWTIEEDVKIEIKETPKIKNINSIIENDSIKIYLSNLDIDIFSQIEDTTLKSYNIDIYDEENRNEIKMIPFLLYESSFSEFKRPEKTKNSFFDGIFTENKQSFAINYELLLEFTYSKSIEKFGIDRIRTYYEKELLIYMKKINKNIQTPSGPRWIGSEWFIYR